MVNFLRGRSDRKLRLFACACCRRMWHLLTDKRSRKAVEVAEGYADELTSREELDAMRGAAGDAWRDTVPAAARIAACHALEATVRNPAKGAARIAARDPAGAVQTDLLRDLFGNPFRLVALDPSWLGWNGSTVVRLAQAIYEDRAFDRLPILGDALEEAGCTDQDILAHCRGQGEHVRGCWVLDLVLGRG
jgi:hypothetical protein